jgi:class 3 adenylate cyclase
MANNFEESDYKIFTSRSDKNYLKELNELLSNLIVVPDNSVMLLKKETDKTNRLRLIKEKCETLKTQILLGDNDKKSTGLPYAKIIEEDGKELNFTHCLRIDFCGLSASTILNTLEHTDPDIMELTLKIKTNFLEVLSAENTKYLNENKIYIKVRFLFEYLYSEMAFSLMKAELPDKRPVQNVANSIAEHCYSFLAEPGLTMREMENSMIKKLHLKSITELKNLFRTLKHLKPELSHRAANTFQLRFTPLPITFCMLLINKVAYNDSYGYTLRNKALSFQYPLIRMNFEHEKMKEQYADLDNHFDYLWHHHLTIIAKDLLTIKTTEIKPPFKITWEEKEAITTKIQPGQKATEHIKNLWLRNLKSRFNSSTKLPFDFEESETKELCVMFTDFKGFSEFSKNSKDETVKIELEIIFKKFDSISKEHGLQKIKTIGDAYMAVCETDRKILEHSGIVVANCLRAGYEMHLFVNRRKTENPKHYFKGMRIGLHYGKVLMNYTFQGNDVWGSDVNFAQRMEHFSDVNSFCISVKCFELLKALNDESDKYWIKGQDVDKNDIVFIFYKSNPAISEVDFIEYLKNL